MKTGKEIGLSYLKLGNIDRSEKQKEIIHDLNGMYLFQAIDIYISRRFKNRVLKALERAKQELEDEQVTDRTLKAKMQLLAIVNDDIAKLEHYGSDENKDQCLAVLKRTLSKTLKEKKAETFNLETALSLAKQVKVIFWAYAAEPLQIRYEPIVRLQTELLEYIGDQLRLENE